MVGKGLIPFIKPGTTFDVDGDISSENAIILVGDLLMEEVWAVDVQPLAILLPEGSSGGARGATGDSANPGPHRLDLLLDRVLTLAQEDVEIEDTWVESLQKANNGDLRPKELAIIQL